MLYKKIPTLSALNILYIGSSIGNSLKKVKALKRLGHKVALIDPYKFFRWKNLVGKWTYDTGALFLEYFLKLRIAPLIAGNYFDIIFIDGGEFFGPYSLKYLKKSTKVIINYNNDDPFSKRDRNKWRLYLKAIPYYNLIVVVREVNVAEAHSCGAQKVLRVFMSVDELDGPRDITEEEKAALGSEVLFVGTWMPERGPFLAQLVLAGLPLSIYGNRWKKAPEWNILKYAWKGGPRYDDDYIKLIQSAKITLGLLSKGNRDLHTYRTMEIPHAGGFFCAERTSEHLQLYEEDVEAVFWADARECLEKCLKYLKDDARRQLIAENSRRRCLANGIFNENVLAKVINEALNYN
jgi:hypothetical protein